MPNSKHTPTPWKLRSQSGQEYDKDFKNEISGGDRHLLVTCYPCDYPAPTPESAIAEANAAFIVKAVNNHEKLVNMLKYFIEITPEPQLVSMGFDSPPEHASKGDFEKGQLLFEAQALLTELEASDAN